MASAAAAMRPAPRDVQGPGEVRGAETALTTERRRVLRLLVQDVLIGREKITIRHRIPARAVNTSTIQHDPQPDTEGDHRAGCQVRWGRAVTANLSSSGGSLRFRSPGTATAQQDTQPLGCCHNLMVETAESPLRCEAHRGFGERPGETDQG